MTPLLLALALGLGQALAQAGPEAPPATGEIRGQVVQADGGDAIADADVILKSLTNGVVIHAKADNTGRFEITNLPSGPYVLTVQLDGYFAVNSGVIESSATGPLQVQAGRPLPTLIVPLRRAAVVSGRVIDSAGQPLARTQVRAFTVGREGGLEVLTMAVTKVSDHRGEFRLFWLTPGEYVIQAEPDESAPPQTSLKAFHPNATTLAAATHLQLNAGDFITGVDIFLPPAIVVPASKPVKVSGQVLSTLTADGHPMPSASVLSLVPHDSADESLPRRVGNSDSRTGLFEVFPVAPGKYDLYARVQDSRGSPSRAGISQAWARTTIEVRDTDLTHVRLLLHPSATVQGVVKVAEGAAILPTGVRVELEPLGSSAKFASVQGMTDLTQGIRADGGFAISGVAEGTYRVRLRGMSSDAVAVQVRLGERDVSESGFDVTSGDPLWLEIIVRPSAK